MDELANRIHQLFTLGFLTKDHDGLIVEQLPDGRYVILLKR